MVNQDKVRLMTRAEWYRQREKRKALTINRYSKRAYVSMQVVKSMIICTVGMLVAVLIWGVFEGEQLLGINDLEVFADIAVRFAGFYAGALIVSAVMAWRTYTRIYTREHGSVKKYYNFLRKINYYNEKEKRKLAGPDRPIGKEGEQQ